MLKFAVKKTSLSIFHDAIARKDFRRVQFLVQNNRRKFDVDELDEDGLTSLQRICFTGNLKLVQLLVTYGADIGIQDKEGWSVLHAAAVAGHQSILRYLIAMGADVSVRNDLEQLPIDLASDLQCVIVLAEAMKRAGFLKLTNTFFTKRPEFRKLIEDKYTRRAQVLETPRNRSVTVSLPLDKPEIDGTEMKNTIQSCEPHGNLSDKATNNDGGVKIIEQEGIPERGMASDNNNNVIALPKRAICKKCHGRKRNSMASTCSNSSDSSSSSSDSAYISSVSLSDSVLVAEPIHSDDSEIESTPVFSPSHSSTPISSPMHKTHNCRKHKRYTKNRSNSSPSEFHQSKATRLLSIIREVGNVNVLNDSGVSLLHEMAGKGDTESVQFLLESGAEVNRQALNGSSPMHEAVRNGNVECTSLLLRSGADLFAETDSGFLPIDLAQKTEVKDLLKHAMAIR